MLFYLQFLDLHSNVVQIAEPTRMPIGKLSSYPSLSVNVTMDKKRGPEEGGALENEKEDKIISFMEMTEADREQEMMRTGKQDHDGRLAADQVRDHCYSHMP